MERGILGVKKDPKNLMLFSFSGGEQWPSSDSNDSDYSDPETKEKKTKKKQHNDGCVKRRRRRHSSTTQEICPPHQINCPPHKINNEVKKKKMNEINEIKVNDQLMMNKQSPDVKSTEMDLDARRSVSADCLKMKLYQKRQETIKSDDDNWGKLVPCVILVKVFKCIVESEGALPFLNRAARVNKLWNCLSKETSLWKRLDLSFGWIRRDEANLLSLAETRLCQLNEINLTGWKKLSQSGYQVLADNCPHLSVVCLSGTGIMSPALMYFTDKCPLSSVNLSSVTTDAIAAKSLQYLLEKRGDSLRALILSFNSLKGFNAVLKSITTKCHELELLEICNSSFSSDFVTFDIEKMQIGCTRLKILRLTNSSFRVTHASTQEQIRSPGFPDLHELSLGTSNPNTGVGSDLSNNLLHRILKRSFGLKLLDLRGCTNITCNSLQSLPIKNLQRLYVSGSSAAKYEGIEIIMTKWQHSLIELDLSWNIYPGMSLDMAMKKLASDPTKSKLEILDLRGTQISCYRVKSLLEGCPCLNRLCLDSCRGLPRGMKKEYSGNILEQLRKDIDTMAAQAEKDANLTGLYQF